jgi:large subunit ribosomal protein L21
VYAVIETGGKQYIVEEGLNLRVEKVVGEKGEEVTFDKVLLVGGEGAPKFGTPLIEGASVSAKVVMQDKDRKILVFHKKRRKGYEKKAGHRQPFTEVKIEKIQI